MLYVITIIQNNNLQDVPALIVRPVQSFWWNKILNDTKEFRQVFKVYCTEI